MSEFNDGRLEWDDEITDDGKAGTPYIVLDEGDYDFTVTNMVRGTFPGSSRIPECNKAELTLSVNTAKGEATVKTDLILYRSLEWKLSSFFRCIGQKKIGENLRMDWKNVVGSHGRAHFKPRVYEKNGEQRSANDVDRYLDPEGAAAPAATGTTMGYGDF